ncbi:hypothetical protein [[Pseudomonas] boreopolis]|uniref:hypothetical protein n=1 Tax=Xanthomonas boreopolis TaxID=86183 RepID=UPI003D9B7188
MRCDQQSWRLNHRCLRGSRHSIDWRTDHHDVMGRTNVRFGQEQALRTPSLAGLYESIRSTG